MEGRKYSHNSVDVTGINVMLNTKDVSEYLKISPNGLEVSSFSTTGTWMRIIYVLQLVTIISIVPSGSV